MNIGRCRLSSQEGSSVCFYDLCGRQSSPLICLSAFLPTIFFISLSATSLIQTQGTTPKGLFSARHGTAIGLSVPLLSVCYLLFIPLSFEQFIRPNPGDFCMAHPTQQPQFSPRLLFVHYVPSLQLNLNHSLQCNSGDHSEGSVRCPAPQVHSRNGARFPGLPQEARLVAGQLLRGQCMARGPHRGRLRGRG